MKKNLLRFGLLAMAAMAVLPVHAKNKDALPEARTLVDRHIAALGGTEALDKAQNGTLSGTFAMPAAGISTPATVWAKGHEKILSKVELPGMGVIQSGISGEIVWAIDPFQGPRILQGNERAQQLESYHPDALRRLPSLVSRMQTTGLAQYDGRPCHKVEIQWRSGRESWDCYATSDGLLLASGGKTTSPMGEVEMVSIVKRYGELSGLKMPLQIEIETLGQKQVMTFTAFDPSAPADSVFELPAPIKTLANAGKK